MKKREVGFFLRLLLVAAGVMIFGGTAKAVSPPPVISSVEISAGTYGVDNDIIATINTDGTGYKATNAGIKINGVSVGSTLNDNGDNTYTVDYAVSEGDADVTSGTPTISVVLKNGTTPCAAYTTLTVTDGTEVLIDANSPADPVITSNTDPIDDTNKSNVSFAGTGEANQEIIYDVYDNVMGNVWDYDGQPIDSSGNFSISGIDVSGLNDGPLDFYVYVRDMAGNWSSSTGYHFTATKSTGAPVMTSGNVDIMGMCTGSGGACVTGDQIKVTWNNSGSGDKNPSVIGVTVNNTDIWQISSPLTAVDDGSGCDSVSGDDVWTACEKIEEGWLSGGTQDISVVAMDGSNQTTIKKTTSFDISNQPAISFSGSDWTDSGPVQSDIINFDAYSNVSANIVTTEYAFSADDVCDASDFPGTSFTGGADFTIAGNHADYLCLYAEDDASTPNETYFLVGQLNVDNTVPVITLTGNATENVANGDAYADAGATANDNVDGDIAGNIITTISNDVNSDTTFDSSVAATYTYHYNVSDAAGNAATEVTRTVIVADAVVLPTIDLTINDGSGLDGYTNLAESAAGWDITAETTGVEDGQVVTCNITDEGNVNTVGPVTGIVSSDVATIASGNLSTLNDGTITASCSVSNIAGTEATDTDSSTKDIIAPTIEDVTSGANSGTFGISDIGTILGIETRFSEPVYIYDGALTLTLSTGGPGTVVNYTNGNETTSLHFDYTIQSGDNSTDLDYAGTDSLAGGTITDAAGNVANLTLPAPGTVGSLGANKDYVIDTIAPVVSALTVTPNSGTRNVGDTVTLNITTDSTDNVPNSIIVNGKDITASATGLPGGEFSADYVISNGDPDVSAGEITASVIFADPAGNTNDPFSLVDTNTLVIDGNNSPTVLNVDAPTIGGGTYGTGTVVPIVVTFSETVNVTGTPRLAVWVADDNRWVDYTGGSGTNKLTFEYTVASGDYTNILDYSGTDALRWTGDIKDGTGNNAILDLASPGYPQSLGFNRTIIIEGVAPVITLLGNATENVANGDAYADAGATANDNVDGDIAGNIITTISNDVNSDTTFDSSVAATYTYHYNVSDAAGNAATEVTRTVIVADVSDTTAPTVSSLDAKTSLNEQDAAGTVYRVAANYDEPMDQTVNPTIAYSSPAPARLQTGTCGGHWETSTQFVFPCNLYDDNEEINDIDIIISGAQDVAGNPQDTATFSAYFSIDTKAPTIDSVDSDGATYDSSSPNPKTITVTFDEAINYTPTIAVGSDAQSVYQNGSDRKNWSFDYAIPSDTATTETITVSAAKDAADNQMVEDAIHTFQVDTTTPSDSTAPTVGAATIAPIHSGVIGSVSNISATVHDDVALNENSCEYTLDGTISFSSIPGSYSGNSVDGTCDFTGVDTSSATSIGVSICDLAGHCTNGALTSVTVDSTGPDASTASPVGGTYKSSQSVTITPPADAVATYYTLNGDAPDDTSTLVTGSVTIDLVSHTSVTLKAVSYDVTGNEGTVMEEHYTYDANGSAGDKMKSAVLAGDITLQGSDPNNTSKITFVHDFTLTNGDADVLFPAGTEMTKTGGGSMDMSQMTLDDITNSLKQAYIGNIAGALSVGIPNLKLSFSKNIEVTIPVGDSYNGQTLNIYYLNAGESDWTSSTFCNVSGGLCVFQTNHATKYSAGDKPTTKSSTSKKHKESHKHVNKYAKYKTSLNKKRYNTVKLIKKTDMFKYTQMWALYTQYKKAGNAELLKLRPLSLEMFRTYRGFSKYKLYLKGR